MSEDRTNGADYTLSWHCVRSFCPLESADELVNATLKQRVRIYLPLADLVQQFLLFLQRELRYLFHYHVVQGCAQILIASQTNDLIQGNMHELGVIDHQPHGHLDPAVLDIAYETSGYMKSFCHVILGETQLRPDLSGPLCQIQSRVFFILCVKTCLLFNLHPILRLHTNRFSMLELSSIISGKFQNVYLQYPPSDIV